MEKDALFTLADLWAALRKCAGDVEHVSLADEDLGETGFNELGYDSLALIETAAYLTERLGAKLPEEALAAAATPNAFVEVVNEYLHDAEEDH